MLLNKIYKLNNKNQSGYCLCKQVTIKYDAIR